jgi:hypothetical protein
MSKLLEDWESNFPLAEEEKDLTLQLQEYFTESKVLREVFIGIEFLSWNVLA